MRLKTYTADNMARAIDLVRRDLGEEAIIVATQSQPDTGCVRITAALEDDAPEGLVVGQRDAEPAYANKAHSGQQDELGRALAFHGLPPKLVDRLTSAARSFGARDDVMALGGALDEVFAFQAIVERLQTRPLMLVGPPGAGKTVACAKLLTRARRCPRAVAAVTTDIRRAGAIEQLQAFTDILGLDLAAPETPQGLAEAMAEARQKSALVIIDTAGTNPFNEAEVSELSELVTISGAEPVLVLSAGGDAIEATEIASAFVRLGSRRLICTRLDVSRRLGGLLAAAQAGGLAFSEVSISAQVATGLSPINPVSLARLLLPSDGGRAPEEE